MGAVALSAACLAGVAAGSVGANPIALSNASFESPAIPIPGQGATEQDFVVTDIPGWDETGPDKFFSPEFQGLIDTGIFINLPFPGPSGTIPPVGGTADGQQVGFMVVDPEAGDTEPLISISQTTGAVFEAGMSYHFTMGLGVSINTPPDVVTQLLLGGDISNPEMLELVIGYGGGTGETINEVAVLPVSALELSFDFTTFEVPLTDFTVSTGVLDALDPAVGQNVRVMVRQVNGAGGAFNLDNARLEAVPEPGSLALMGVAGAWLLRRRRA